jgi:hypothetical protein
MSMTVTPSQTALIIAHPGHELRLTGWISRTKPIVHILTSGSRHGHSRSRLEASRILVESLGGSPGEVFGWMEDRALYTAIMSGALDDFDEPLARLIVSLATTKCRLVVCDAWQLYSPAHDIAHLLARAAVASVNRQLGSKMRLREFAVVPPQQSLFDNTRREAERVELSEAEVLRKIQRVADYPDVERETADFLRLSDLSSLAIESLDKPLAWSQLKPPRGTVPLYETFGEERVAAGHYTDVLRWRHIKPFVDAFRRRAKGDDIQAQPDTSEAPASRKTTTPQPPRLATGNRR